MKNRALLAFSCLLPCIVMAEVDLYPNFLESFAYADTEQRESLALAYMPGTQENLYWRCIVAQSRGDLEEAQKILDTWEHGKGFENKDKSLFDRAQLRQYFLTSNVEKLAQIFHISLYFPSPRDPAKKYDSKIDFTDTAQKMAEFRPYSALPAGLPYVFAHPGGYLNHPSGNGAKFECEWLKIDARRSGPLDLPGEFEMLLRNQTLPKKDATYIVRPDPFFARMTLEQLKAFRSAVKGTPQDVDSNDAFVNAWLRAVEPTDLDLANRGSQARLESLRQKIAFLKTVSGKYSDTAKNLRMELLELERENGRYPKQDFIEYLQIINTKNTEPSSSLPLQISRIANSVISSKPVFKSKEPYNNPLIIDYLENLCNSDSDFKEFQHYVHGDILEPIWYCKVIASGQTVPGLAAKTIKELSDKVELDWLATCRKSFDSDDPVALDLRVKNVANVTIDIYDVDMSAALSHGELNATTALDGAKPKWTKSLSLSDTSPFKRSTCHIDFPELSESGCYIIECSGGGIRNRAVIRKGALDVESRVTSAGIAVEARDKKGSKIHDFSVWMDGICYQADSNAVVRLPFAQQDANNPHPRNSTATTCVVTVGRLSERINIVRPAETYSLELKTLFEPEAFLPGRTAKVLLRPILRTACDQIVAPTIIEEPTLEIITEDAQGIASKQTRKCQIDETGLIEVTMHVPPNTARVSFALNGRIPLITADKYTDVSNYFYVRCAPSDLDINNVILRRTPVGWDLNTLGRALEPIPGRGAQMQLRSNLVRDMLDNNRILPQVASNSEGIISIIASEDVYQLENVFEKNWTLPQRESADTPSRLVVENGTDICLPALGATSESIRSKLSLVEVNSRGAYIRDYLDEAVTINNGSIKIHGLGEGDYRFAWRALGPIAQGSADRELRIHVVGNKVSKEQPTAVASLAVTAIAATTSNITVQVLGATPDTRVHLIARRTATDPDPTQNLFVRTNEPDKEFSRCVQLPQSLYLTTRRLGDEERYVMERKADKGHIGSPIADRPSLLVSPYSTTANLFEPISSDQGSAFLNPNKQSKQVATDLGSATTCHSLQLPNAFHRKEDLTYLAEPAIVLANLVPATDGTVKVSINIGDRQEIIAVATDGEYTARRIEAIGPAAPLPARAVASTTNHSEITCISTGIVSGASISLNTGLNSRWRTYTSLGEVFTLMQSANPDPDLAAFSFVTKWPELSQAQKIEKYAQYACHELDFFLRMKDPEFFDAVVKPSIKAKRAKDLVDDFLAGNSTEKWTSADNFAKNGLNHFERALLGGSAAVSLKHLRDSYNAEPDNIVERGNLFETAIRCMAANASEPMAACEMDMQYEDAADDLVLEERAPESNVAMFSSLAQPTKQVTPRGLTMGRGGSSRREDAMARKSMPKRWKQVDKTCEWHETHYYKSFSRREIPFTPFWAELAERGIDKPFLPDTILDSISSDFTTRMAVLAMLDLPFQPSEPEVTAGGNGSLTIKATTSTLIFANDTAASAQVGTTAEAANVTLVQRFLRDSDDAPVTDCFKRGIVYRTQPVVLNTTSSNIVVQYSNHIPDGAVVLNGISGSVATTFVLDAFSIEHPENGDSAISEVAFYFPEYGEASDSTVHASAYARTIGGLTSSHLDFNVTSQKGPEDKSSWKYLAENASEEELLAFLRSGDLTKKGVRFYDIYWRMSDKAFCEKVLDALSSRGHMDTTLWGFAFRHGNAARSREFFASLKTAAQWQAQVGGYLDSELFKFDAEQSGAYEHLEYWPLVNARVNAIKGGYHIANTKFASLYKSFLENLAHKKALSSEDELAATIHLLAMERVAEARKHFQRVKRDAVQEIFQYDYAAAWLALCDGKAPNKNINTEAMPLNWKKRFEQLLAAAPTDKASIPDSIAAESYITLVNDNGKVRVASLGVEECTLNFRPVDIELLFSTYPFQLAEGEFSKTGQAGIVHPSATLKLKIGADGKSPTVEIPTNIDGTAVLVEAVGGTGAVRAETMVLAPGLEIRPIASRGILLATDQKGVPAAGTYIKVYARYSDGDTGFYRDGYTDARGLFDYASLSGEHDTATRFAILAISPDGLVQLVTTPPPAM